MIDPNKDEHTRSLSGPPASTHTETQKLPMPHEPETGETAVCFCWHAAMAGWSLLALLVLWGWTGLWIAYIPKPAASDNIHGVPGPAFYGLVYSTFALIPVWILSYSLKLLIDKTYPWAKEDQEFRNPKYKFHGLAVSIGILERLAVTSLLALGISGAGAFIGTWILVKMASGWNRLQKSEPRYKARSISALIMSLVSLSFAAVAAWLWRSAT